MPGREWELDKYLLNQWMVREVNMNLLIQNCLQFADTSPSFLTTPARDTPLPPLHCKEQVVQLLRISLH